MKKLFTILFTTLTIAVQAQTWVDDSVAIGAGYPNRVFYSLQNGIVGTMTFNDKDFLVDVSEVQSASIRINGGFSAALYEYTAGDTTDWATLDTAGLFNGTNFTRRRDDQHSMSPSAFEQGATGHPDYGWGIYNSVSHNVLGVKIYVYKTSASVATWKKVWIKKLDAITSAYTIWVDNIGGGALQELTISKAGVTNKNFIYYSFVNDSTYNAEPNADTYDLVFTKHEGDYLMSGAFIPNQAVTGIENNFGVLSAEADNILPDNAVHTSYTLTEDLQGIGARWKQLNASFQWVVEDSLSYFIQDLDSNIWQVRFTGFVGSSAGKYRFQKRQVAFVSVEGEAGKLASFNVFPNPTSDFINLVYVMNDNQQNATLNIVDINGKTVLNQILPNQTGINQTQIDLTALNLPVGVYVAMVQVGNYSGTQKFIVQ